VYQTPFDVQVDNTGAVEKQAEDPINIQVREFLEALETAPQEVQVAVCSRLMQSLAAKLTASQITKAISVAKEPPAAAKRPAPRARNARAPRSERFARIDSQLGQLSDPTDPLLAWQHFGRNATSLYEVLRYEPLGVLEAMLLHDHIPPGPKPRGKSREILAIAIVQRFDAGFGR
jgi:hypothetical protein